MKEVLDEKLQSYLHSLLPPIDEVITALRNEAKAAHVPIVDEEVANLLRLLVEMNHSQSILEIGTAIGRSAFAMAEAMPQHGTLLTIELDKERAKRAAAYFKQASVSEKIEQIVADAREYLPQLAKEKPHAFDFIFVDAAKGQYLNFFPHLEQLLKPGGVIVADNVLLNGWVIDLSYPNHRRKTFVLRMRQFLEQMQANPNYSMSLLPLGDGVLILRKKENRCTL